MSSIYFTTPKNLTDIFLLIPLIKSTITSNKEKVVLNMHTHFRKSVKPIR